MSADPSAPSGRPTTTIAVRAEQPYAVEVGPGALGGLADLAGDPAGGGALRVAVLHPAALADVAERARRLLGDVADGPREGHVHLVALPDGEAAKEAGVLVSCWSALAEAGFTRSDLVVGLGGGAATDLAGFVAASFLRGIAVAQVPTTVLAMVDAAVGGKTGIDLPAGKNLVGAFHEPRGVLADTSLLATLPRADLRAGLAEIIKAGFIADPAILELITADPADALDPNGERLQELLERSIAVKARVVSADLREATTGAGVADVGREQLNYGHTLAHAIETREDYTWRHGDAVAVGCVFAAEVAQRLGMLSIEDVRRHRDGLAALGLPTAYAGTGGTGGTGDPALVWPELRAIMSRDKKARGAVLRLVLLEGMQQPKVVAGVDEGILADAYRAVGR